MDSDLLGLPTTIGRYQVLGVLGTGGMGRVVRAHDPVLKRDLAIKLVEPRAVAEQDFDELRFMFHREARATAQLRHANIVEVHDYSGPDAELLYLVCELIDGPTLRDVLDEKQKLDAPIVAALGFELSLALAHAHGQGIVHRDIKPENIFWTANGRVVLADFGIAKAFAGGVQLGGTVIFGATRLYGSPAYMAPEQLTGGEVGPATDLYALAAVLAEAWTGESLFSGDTVTEILDAVKFGRRRHLSGIYRPASLARLLEGQLALSASGRVAEAKKVSAALRDILDELGVSDPRLALSECGTQTQALLPDTDSDQVTQLVAHESEEISHATDARPTTLTPTSGAPNRTGGGNRWPVVTGAGLLLLMLLAGFWKFWNVARWPDRRAEPPGVAVTLHVAGKSAVVVDGKLMGTYENDARLQLAPGRHRLETRTGTQLRSREIVILAGTQPEFDLNRNP